MGCIIKTTITNWKQLNPSSFMPVGLTICHSPTDKSLLSGVEPGNYQNGQNYRIMELSGAGGRASGKAICSSSRQLFFCLFFKLGPDFIFKVLRVVWSYLDNRAIFLLWFIAARL